MLVTDHEVDDLAAADRVAVLNGGRLIIDGTAREVLSRPEALTLAGVLPSRAGHHPPGRGIGIRRPLGG
jgi:ABC-type multidrug transport system ATPase subunit